MRYSQFYIRTKRDVAKQESINAYLLVKAGYISQVAAGVYALLPLGLRSIQKIEQIVREEMNKIDASEVSLTALQLKSTWEKAGRWQDPDYRSILYYDPDADMALAPTHEEPMTALVKDSVQSYRDLPVILYQFQTKFRKELRAKSGLLRGREFRMKDLYSFHPDEESHKKFYEQCAKAYLKVFSRMDLTAYRTKASGGIFSKEFSDEFQVLSETGEDEILINRQKNIAYNQEVEDQIPAKDKESMERVRSIEVGNIFHLGTKYTQAFDLFYLDSDGSRKPAVMGSYGIGISRILGTLAEIYNDERGLKLPSQVAPFHVQLIDLVEDQKMAELLHKDLTAKGIEVLYDDRDLPAGAKLVEADLIGNPLRVLNSLKTAQEGKVEIKVRSTGEVVLVDREQAVAKIIKLLQ